MYHFDLAFPKIMLKPSSNVNFVKHYLHLTYLIIFLDFIYI